MNIRMHGMDACECGGMAGMSWKLSDGTASPQIKNTTPHSHLLSTSENLSDFFGFSNFLPKLFKEFHFLN